jgi:hypothetical protein
MERQFGLITRLRWRRNKTLIGKTVHVYRRLAPFSATLCGEIIVATDKGWGPFGPPTDDPPLEAVECGRCRAYLRGSAPARLQGAS